VLREDHTAVRRGRPQIYSTTRRFGTVLENVVFEPETRALDLDDDRYTENTRAAYDSFIDNAEPSGRADIRRTSSC
jgi:phosphoenolpyruvate carboxykinase (ATP)